MKATILSGQLQRLGLENTVFENIDCSFVGPGGCLGLSAYACGILCAGLLDRCKVIVDYANHRIAFIPASQEKSDGGPNGPLSLLATRDHLVEPQKHVHTKRWDHFIDLLSSLGSFW